jgi:hypothetical protein
MRFILNRKSEFIIYSFIINNDTILYPLGGGGGLWWKFEIKVQDRTLSKNKMLNLCLVYLIYIFYLGQVLPEGKCGHRNVLSKRQVWMSIFHIINFKKKIHGHRSILWFTASDNPFSIFQQNFILLKVKVKVVIWLLIIPLVSSILWFTASDNPFSIFYSVIYGFW